MAIEKKDFVQLRVGRPVMYVIDTSDTDSIRCS